MNRLAEIGVSDVYYRNIMASDNGEVTLEILYQELVKTRTELKLLFEASEARTLLEIEELKQKVKKVEEENNTLRNEVEYLVRETKKKNILVFGLDTQEEELTPLHLCQKINDLLEIKINPQDISNYYTLGKTHSSPLKIEFVSQVTKKIIFQKVKKLKGTNISVSPDLTKQQQQERKILLQYLKKERGNSTNKVYIKGNGLYINDIKHTIEQLIEAEATIHGRSNSAPSTPLIQTNYRSPEPETSIHMEKIQNKNPLISKNDQGTLKTDKIQSQGNKKGELNTPKGPNLENKLQNRVRTRFRSNK